MKDPLGVSPSKGNQGTTGGKEKILLTSVGIEPTTSGLDLPLTLELILCSTICVYSVTRHNIHIYMCTLTFSSPRFTTSIVPDFLCPTSQLSRQSNGSSNPEVVGSIPTEVKRIFSLPCEVP